MSSLIRTTQLYTLFLFAVLFALSPYLVAADPWRELQVVGDDLFSDGDFSGSLAFYSKLIETKPNSVEAYNGRARLYTDMGLWELAESDLVKAINLFYTTGEKGRAELDHLYHRLSYTREALGKLPQALDDVEQALQINPAYKNAWITRGNILHDMMDLNEAEASYHKSLEIAPDDLIARINLIRLSRTRGEWKTAHTMCHEWSSHGPEGEAAVVRGETIGTSPAIRVPVSPSAPLLYQHCSEVSDRLGETEERDRYRELAASAVVSGVEDLMSRAEARMDLKLYEAALEDFSKILEKRPYDKEARFRHATALFSLDRSSEAEEDYDFILSFDTSNGWALAGKAEAQARLGNLEEALTLAQESVKLLPYSSYALANLAIA